LGLPLAFGTDWPATDLDSPNPIEMIFAAVTRTTSENIHAEIWHPEQRITPAEAIRCYTLNPAYAEFTEKRKGSITPGKLADLIVLSKNILEVDPAEIMDAGVDLTLFNGEIVSER
jgi:predicted amidohydrolase YtcJ